MSCQSNSTAVCRAVHYIETEAPRTVTDTMCAVARYYHISSKADRGDIFIDQISSYRTPLHASIAEIKAQLLPLSSVYEFIRRRLDYQDFCAD